MADEMTLPIIRGDGFEDPDQHWFLCEAIWNIRMSQMKLSKELSSVQLSEIVH
jgi:hypothetical protein